MTTDESQDETHESIASEVQELAWQLTKEITILKAENAAQRSLIKELQEALRRKPRYVVHSPYGI